MISQVPSGLVNEAVSQIEVTFSAPIDPGTFTVSDVIVAGPSVILVNDVTQVTAVTFRIHTSPITADGDYVVLVGPEIWDLAGNLMDQNRNGVFGETDDAFVWESVLVLPDLELALLDAPGSVANGRSFTVAYTVRNGGQITTTSAWSDRVVLSLDGVFGNNDDVLLGLVDHDTELAPGEQTTRQVTGEAPFGVVGRVGCDYTAISSGGVK